MKRLMALAAVLLCACAPVAPANSVPGAQVEAPAGDDWRVTSETAKVIYAREDGAASEIVVLQSLATPTFDTDDAFFQYAENLKATEFAPKPLRGGHFNNTRFQGAACLSYDRTQDGDDAGETTRLLGYLCRHPTRAQTAIDMSFTRSAPAFEMPNDRLDVANAYLNSVTFTE